MVEGIGRALDVARSRRPLTLAIVGPRPESEVLTALSRFARVLVVGELADEASLANWLAVLLPLRLPQPTESRDIDALEDLKASADPLMIELIDSASLGAAAVTERLVSMIEEPFLETDNPGQEALE